MTTVKERFDVIVVGAGASGIPAAIGAARQGARVLLLENDALPGGAPIDQFVLMPDGGPRVGVCREMVNELESRYPQTPIPVDRWYYYWYQPSDVLLILNRLIRAEAGLTLRCSVPRVEPLVEGARVTGVRYTTTLGVEHRISAGAVIDATGTAEIADLAGAATMYGRDGQNAFGEAPADEPGPDTQVQLCTWQYISTRLEGAEHFDFGNLKGCRTGLKSGLRGIPLDEGVPSPVNPSTFLHWGCRVECADTRDPIELAKTQAEALALIGPDIDTLRGAGYQVHLAPKIGVRESRRVVGEEVITFNHLVEGRISEDAIFITNRGADIWAKGKNQLSYPPVQVYGIPYGAVIPKGVDGLLVVGKAMSGTHLAMSAYRVQCILAGIGQAAGVAAALSAQRKLAVRDLSIANIHQAMAGQDLRLDEMKRQIAETEG